MTDGLYRRGAAECLGGVIEWSLNSVVVTRFLEYETKHGPESPIIHPFIRPCTSAG